MTNPFTLFSSLAIRIALFQFFLLFSFYVHAQEWLKKETLESNNLFLIEKEFNQYWEKHQRTSGDGYKPFSRWIDKTKNNIDKEGNILPLLSLKEIEELFQKQDVQDPITVGHAWYPIGPRKSPQNGIGRINEIESHYSDPMRFYAAAPSGGVWISDDAGASWYTTTDKVAQIGVSEIEIHPTDTNQIIVATGDADAGDTRSEGLIKSSDFGLSWDPLPMHPAGCGMNCQIDYSDSMSRIYALLWHQSNPDIIIVCSNGGTIRTSDGGETWTNNNLKFRDLKAHPVNPDILYGFGLNDKNCYVSQDAGENWTLAPISNGSAIVRGELAVTADEPNAVFLAGAVGSGHVLYKSVDQGLSYTQLPSNSINLGRQSFYNWVFSVDPEDSEILYLGGVSLFKSFDSGLTWTNITCEQTCAHVDFHYLGFLHGSLHVGSDGGIYKKSSDVWTDMNNQLQITQYYRCSGSETDSITVMAGSQDNGTHLYDYTWKRVLVADGMDNDIDPTDNQILYYSFQNGTFYKSTTGGREQKVILSPSMTGTKGVWVTPFMIDHVSPNILYAGYNKLWKSNDRGENWFGTSNNIHPDAGLINYFDVATSNPNVIYLVSKSELFKSIDGGASWIKPTQPSSYTTRIEINPTDENELWLCGSQSIYKSSDGGQTWEDITWNIPTGITINAIAYDRNSNGHLYIGTSVGVWFNDGIQSEWKPFNNLLPNVYISDLQISESYDKIRAATYGRGLWESYTVGHYYCYDSLFVTHTIDEGLYHASKNVSSNGIKTTNTESEFKAGMSIDLLPDFEVEMSTTFSAYIEDCAEINEVYYKPLELGSYCESAEELPNSITGIYQVDLTQKESYWFKLISDNRFRVDILSCGQGANTNLKLYTGIDCDLTLSRDISEYCSMDNSTDYHAAGVGGYILINNQEYYLQWSLEDVEEITTCSAIQNSNDDAEEYLSSGYMYRNSSDLELTLDNENQLVGLLFKDIDIPQGATITSAYIQFTTDETSSDPTALTIKAEAVDNASSFSSTASDISSRSTTVDSVNWAPSEWSIQGEKSTSQKTPDLSSVISEIIDRPGFARFNDIAIIISGTGKRTAVSFDGSELDAPVLCISYEDSLVTNTEFDFEISFVDSSGFYCHHAAGFVPNTVTFSKLLQDGGTNGHSARWYSYIPPSNGTIDIISCINTFDTNLRIWEGDCQNKTILLQNSDECALDPTYDPVAAALYDVPVIANQQYLIEWDSQDGSFFVEFSVIENF